jgi:hypothetical protein
MKNEQPLVFPETIQHLLNHMASANLAPASQNHLASATEHFDNACDPLWLEISEV